MRPMGSAFRVGCAMISATTTWPSFTPARLSGAMRMSWLMRLFSAITNATPCSMKMRPTTRWLARSSTSTMCPSRRPRRSTPVTRASTVSPCSALCISLGPRKRSSRPSSGLRKPKPSGCPMTLPLMSPALSGSSSAPRRLRITSPSRSMAPMRRSMPSRSAAPRTASRSSSSASATGTPASASASRIASRVGISRGITLQVLGFDGQSC